MAELLWMAESLCLAAALAAALCCYHHLTRSRRRCRARRAEPSTSLTPLSAATAAASTVPLDQRWRSRAWLELAGKGAEEPALDGGERLGAEGYLLARALRTVPQGSRPCRRILLQPGPSLPSALLRRVAERRWPEAAERAEVVPSWWECGGGYDALVVGLRSFVPNVHNWQEEADHLALHAYRHLRPGGELWFAATSMVDLKLLLAQLQRNGYEVEVLAQELFRWEDMYYDDLNYVAVANQLQCYVHDHKHRRLERVSAVRATLKPPMRRRQTTQRPAHSEAHHRTES